MHGLCQNACYRFEWTAKYLMSMERNIYIGSGEVTLSQMSFQLSHVIWESLTISTIIPATGYLYVTVSLKRLENEIWPDQKR